MAQSMILESQMPDHFSRFAYASVCFLHNQLPNSQCPKLSPHERLFGNPPSIGTKSIVHVPAVQQPHKLAPRGSACRLLKPLMTGGWLLWEPKSDKMVQSASVIFPRFQSSGDPKTGNSKGSLSHIVNRAALGSVPMVRYFRNKNTAIDTLPLTKDITIPDHLGQALSRRYRDHWRAACKRELNQMLAQDVWEEVPKTREMKTIGHHWVFDIKQQANGGIEKFKARLVARGYQQQPGIDCTKTYAPTASLMSLRLSLTYAVCCRWPMASFDVSGAYLFSPVEETVFVEPPLQLWPHLKGKALRLKKAGRCWWIFL
ncbi:hypothetical protein O181_098154 [Austropuccinia psidii MF-1]|uniref:Reverse transcriptase Ty1/copia-type domain-containing protein n=1 Tax=Austropuccinia psidii MF-1 TaxID=1389203 RepID=A0A9Q3PE93_9BASI|nr:hypothetical protein [Austropuccinia psidii MF-1]